jgi:hypothetical protein
MDGALLLANSPLLRYTLSVRIFKNTRFSRYARKENIADDELKKAVSQIEAGNFDAGLGGHVFKQRIARPGEGKSGGYRVIVCLKSGERSFFVHGFAKSNLGNINRKEERKLKEAARDLLSMTENQLSERLKQGTLEEIL